MSDDSDEDVRSEDSDEEEEVAVDRYHRISATNISAFLEARTSEFPSGTDTLYHVQALLTHQSPGADGYWQAAPPSFMVECQSNLMLWGTDGRRRLYKCYMDENGLNHQLEWNHRMNAIVDVGRFTSLDQTMIDEHKNQRLKDSHGSNYFCGDVVIEVPVGSVPPDHDVYGDDPIDSIMRRRPVSPAMVARYGEIEARRKLAHNSVMDLSNLQAVMATGSVQWIQKRYKVTPYGMTDTMRQLLQSWGYSDEVIGVMVIMGV